MKISQAFPSKYLRAQDLDGKAVKAVISNVEMGAIGQGEEADHKPVVYFEGKTKGLMLNKTNASMISQSYGDETDNWIGKDLEIRPEITQFRGETVPCLRVYTERQEAVSSEEIPF